MRRNNKKKSVPRAVYTKEENDKIIAVFLKGGDNRVAAVAKKTGIKKNHVDWIMMNYCNETFVPKHIKAEAEKLIE